nr:hypothetical protein CFP56_04526 [Quercus suber]
MSTMMSDSDVAVDIDTALSLTSIRLNCFVDFHIRHVVFRNKADTHRIPNKGQNVFEWLRDLLECRVIRLIDDFGSSCDYSGGNEREGAVQELVDDLIGKQVFLPESRDTNIERLLRAWECAQRFLSALPIDDLRIRRLRALNQAEAVSSRLALSPVKSEPKEREAASPAEQESTEPAVTETVSTQKRNTHRATSPSGTSTDNSPPPPRKRTTRVRVGILRHSDRNPNAPRTVRNPTAESLLPPAHSAPKIQPSSVKTISVLYKDVSKYTPVDEVLRSPPDLSSASFDLLEGKLTHSKLGFRAQHCCLRTKAGRMLIEEDADLSRALRSCRSDKLCLEAYVPVRDRG